MPGLLTTEICIPRSLELPHRAKYTQGFLQMKNVDILSCPANSRIGTPQNTWEAS